MYVSTKHNKFKTEAAIKRLYHVLCSSNMKHYRIFSSDSTFINLRYTYIVLYKVIQTIFFLQEHFANSLQEFEASSSVVYMGVIHTSCSFHLHLFSWVISAMQLYLWAGFSSPSPENQGKGGLGRR